MLLFSDNFYVKQHNSRGRFLRLHWGLPSPPSSQKTPLSCEIFFSIKVTSIFFIISHIFIYLLITFYIIFSTNLFNISVTFSLRLDLFKFHEFQYSQCGIRKIQQRNFVFHENSHSILISFC